MMRMLFIGLLLLSGSCHLAAQQVGFAPAGSFTVSGNAYLRGGESLTNGVNVNDIRFGVKADLSPRWNGELILGFTRGQVSFKEIFVRYSFPDGQSRLQLGHFAEPFGLEYIESPPFNRFATIASSSQAFDAKRNLGVLYSAWNSFVWGAAGVFADGQLMKAPPAGPQGYAFTGRMVLNPFRGDGLIIHGGAAATWRRADGNGNQPRTISFSSNGESAVDNSLFASVVVPDAYAQCKFAGEVILSQGRCLLSGEAFLSNVSRTGGQKPYHAGGFYLLGGFLLHGDREYNYDPANARLAMCRPGTVELLLRYSLLDLNDTASSLCGGRLDGLVFQLNWYASPFLRFRLSASRHWTDRHSPSGNGMFDSIDAQLMIMFD